MRLIDADELIRWLRIEQRVTPPANIYLVAWLNEIKKMIETIQTLSIDAVPVERDIPKAPTDQQLEEDAYGAWGSLYGNCPNCRGSVYEEQNYCEKCGQRLDWGREQGTLETTRNYSKRENGDPNGFNDETVQALKDTTERKNLSKVYETLDDMYADMGVSEWHEYIYRERETSDGVDGDRMGELVRCKDCKHYLEDSYGEDEWVMCRRTNLYTDGEKYCAWAERREDD